MISIRHEYCKQQDITFVWEDDFNENNTILFSTTLKTFYYGEKKMNL